MEDPKSQSAAPLGETAALSRYLAEATLDNVPEEVLMRSNHLTLDGIGCAIVGARLPWSERAVGAVMKLEGEGPAAVIGWGAGSTPTGAALLNSTFIQGFELDDYHELAPLHSCAVVLPAALATANALGPITGEKFALAVILGFEVGPRVGLVLDAHALLRSGWHCGAVVGGVAAAVTAAKLRDLDADGIEDALGIAATQASGLMSAQFESMVKRMNHGFGARNGVLAACLAQAGFTGIKGVFEREYGGVCSTFGELRETHIDELISEFGVRWELDDILVKPYASGATTHPAADAMMHARQALGVTPQEVRSITIKLPKHSFDHGGWRLDRPVTPTGAQMNVAYVSAVALLDSAVFVDQFAPTRIDADDVWELIERTTVLHSRELDDVAEVSGTPRVTHVSIELLDGTRHNIEVSEAQGTKSKHLSNDEVRKKFRKVVTGRIDHRRRDEIEALALNLHELDDVSEFVELLRPIVEGPY